EEYREANRLLPLPDFLFNLGQAYRLKGELKTAADFYRQYLAAKPDGPVSAEAREHLASLEAALRPPPMPEPPPKPPEPPTVAPPPVVTAPIVVDKPRRKSRAWVWGVVGGAAAVALGVGLGVGLTVGNNPHDPVASFGAFTLK